LTCLSSWPLLQGSEGDAHPGIVHLQAGGECLDGGEPASTSLGRAQFRGGLDQQPGDLPRRWRGRLLAVRRSGLCVVQAVIASPPDLGRHRPRLGKPAVNLLITARKAHAAQCAP
jgi:hypothetical protein